jgi:hypothetical protein
MTPKKISIFKILFSTIITLNLMIKKGLKLKNEVVMTYFMLL